MFDDVLEGDVVWLPCLEDEVDIEADDETELEYVEEGVDDGVMLLVPDTLA